jgi:NADH-quinone oxidoreductase subunit D
MGLLRRSRSVRHDPVTTDPPAAGDRVAGPVEEPERDVDAVLRDQTDEGSQEMRRSDDATRRALREIVMTGELWPDPDPEDETMIVNMGPQHPSTHGVLRIMLELEGETVLRLKPVVGYLHTGMEKTAEELTYVQGSTNVTRMDYAAPFSNETVLSLAVERLLQIDIPPRATWIRMMLNELNRVSSHLLFLATNGLDLGASTAMIIGWREREETLRLFETITGLRMNHNFIRPGGVAADLHDGWQDDVLALCDHVEVGVGETDELLTNNPIWLERTVGVGVITTEQALALGASGPILRSTGFPWDLRKEMPNLAYEDVDFDVIYTENGDCFDRYRIKLYEVLESLKIVRQCVERMPEGDYRVQDRKVTPPPRARIDESMEALIHHFKIFTEGFRVPPGETYQAVESPRGELGCYLVSDGTAKPARMHIRAPSFYNLQTAGAMMRGGLVADAVTIISSVDPIMGDVDR